MQKNKIQGFTLYELLITCSLVSILLLISIFSWNHTATKTNNEIMSSQLIKAIQLARTEAMIRGLPITLCQSSNQKQCGGEWKEGYIIMLKNEVLFHFQTNRKGILNWRSFPNYPYLQFFPTGFSHVENGTFWFCESKKAKPKWAVVINKSARARIILPNKEGNILDGLKNVLKC